MAAVRRTNIVDAGTGLVGRSDDLLRLEALFEDNRLVTLLGPAGVGKSRLAVAFSAELSPKRFPGGIWRCDLEGVSNEEQLCAAFASTLSLSGSPRGARALGRALAGSGSLFVLLDNAERARVPLAECLKHLLPANAGLTCLATSRQRIGLANETLFSLEPLSDAAGVALLQERMNAVRGVPIHGDPVVLSEIVRRLDALPLAIELLATHAGALEPSELLVRLDPTLPFLVSADPSAPERSRSLLDALKSSVLALDAFEQRVLSTCALFRGPFELADAEAVTEAPPQPVASALTRLWERSLIESRHQEGATSLRLYRGAAEYARTELVRQPRAAEWVAHFTNRMLELAEQQLASESEEKSVRWLIRHGPTLAELARSLLAGSSAEAALPALLAASRAALLRGPVQPTLSLFEPLVMASLPPALRARALHARARLRQRDGHSQLALDDYDAALALASRSEPSSALNATIAIDLGSYHRHQGDFKRAEALYRKAHARFRKLGDRPGQARCVAAFAALAHERGDLQRAKRLFEQALKAARELSLALTAASTLQNLGIVLLELGEREAASRAFDAAIAGHRELGHRRFEGVAEFDRASLALEQGALGKARDGFLRALELAQEVGDRREVGLSMALLAACEAGLGDHARAAQGLHAAETVLRAVNEPALLNAVELYRGHVDLARALQAFEDGDQEDQRSELDRARLRLDTSASDGAVSDEVRFAHRTLKAAYERHLALDAHAIVDFGGTWFRAAGGERVDLTRRAPLRRLVSELSRQLVHAPDAPVPIDRLIRCGWPEQTAVTPAAKNRLHVAITLLRKAGLESHLVTRDKGYLLERAIAWGDRALTAP